MGQMVQQVNSWFRILEHSVFEGLQILYVEKMSAKVESWSLFQRLMHIRFSVVKFETSWERVFFSLSKDLDA